MNHVHRLLLLGLILLAFALRVYHLDTQELRGDEVFGYFFSLRPFNNIIEATIDLQEPHPVASYFLAHVWLDWAENTTAHSRASRLAHNESIVRFLSVWFGVLAVPLLYQLARALSLVRTTQLMATLLLTISPYAIWHSQDARMYTMSLALTTASTLCAVNWLRVEQKRVWAVGYIVTNWLALHTHYFAVFILIAQNLFMVSTWAWSMVSSHRIPLRDLHGGTRQDDVLIIQGSTLVRWIIMQTVIALAYLPWLFWAYGTLTGYRGNGDSPPLIDALLRALRIFTVGNGVFYSAVFAIILLALGIASLYQTKRHTAWLLSLYLFVPLLITWTSAIQRPIFNERYLIAATPPFYLLIAAGISLPSANNLWQCIRGQCIRGQCIRGRQDKRISLATSIFLVCTVVALMLLSTQQHYMDPSDSKTRGWRKLAVMLNRYSDDLPSERVRIAQNFPDPTLWYYYHGSVQEPVQHIMLPPAPHDRAGSLREIRALLDADVERILIPIQPAPNWDGSNIAVDALSASYINLVQTPVSDWLLHVYVRVPLTNREAGTPVATFVNGLTLGHVDVSSERLVPRGLLVVYMTWHYQESQQLYTQMTGTEKVFVQLLNEAGQLVAQDDRPLGMPPVDKQTGEQGQDIKDHQTVYGILLPADLASGTYRLIAGLYEPSVEGAPRILTDSGADHVEVMKINY
ncbi:MAG: phospholipid carrier-dependent glycosyltransferase [Chloroflexota bacterium]